MRERSHSNEPQLECECEIETTTSLTSTINDNDDHNENDNDYDNNDQAKEREIDAAFRLLDDFDFFFLLFFVSSFTLIFQCCVLFCQVKFSVCLVGLHDVRIGNIFFSKSSLKKIKSN